MVWWTYRHGTSHKQSSQLKFFLHTCKHIQKHAYVDMHVTKPILSSAVTTERVFRFPINEIHCTSKQN